MDKTEDAEPTVPLARKETSHDDDLPTRPRPAADDDATLVWLVSFADEDDRELTAPQIAEALVRGDITRDTIVWRQGFEDWVTLASVPSLARLVPSSGETAAAPFAALKAAVPAVTSALPRPKGIDVKKRAEAGATPLPKIGAKSMAAAPTAGKGSTKLGLPRVDQKPADAAANKPEVKPVLANKPDVKPVLASKPEAKSVFASKPEVKPVLASKPEAKSVFASKPEPSPAPKPASPKAATASASSPKPAPVVQTPNAPRAKATSAADIWGEADDLDALSVEPESVRPPSPAPARAIQRARALSPGTLGVKKPPPPPSPKHAPERQAPERPAPSAPDSGTPSLTSLTAHAPVAAPSFDDILNLGGGPVAEPALGPPTIDVSAIGTEPSEAPTPAIERPFALGDVAEEVAPKPLLEAPAGSPAGDATVAREKTTAAIASPAPVVAKPPEPRKRSALPIAAGALAVAAVAAVLLRPHGAPPSEPERPPAAERVAEPTPTGEPRAPEQPATPPATAAATVAPATPSASAAVPEPAPASPVSGSKPGAKAAEKASTESAPRSVPTKTTEVSQAPPSKAEKPKPEEPKPAPAQEPEKTVDIGGEFDKAAAASALATAAQQASSCRKEGDPSGVAVVHVTFSNAGHATRAVIEGPPFAGTATGGCIAAALRRATVPPYAGDRVTVSKRVVIE